MQKKEGHVPVQRAGLWPGRGLTVNEIVHLKYQVILERA